jgi:hypothetical protein
LTALLAAAALAAGPNPIPAENALGGAQPEDWLQPAKPVTSI